MLVSRWTPFASSYGRRQAGTLNRTPGELDQNVPVIVHPQDSPEPGHQGGAYGTLVPSRTSRRFLTLFFHDQTKTQEERFVAVQITHDPQAAYPRGRQSPFSPRANIQVPSHVAYGSLFIDRPEPYGLG